MCYALLAAISSPTHQLTTHHTLVSIMCHLCTCVPLYMPGVVGCMQGILHSQLPSPLTSLHHSTNPTHT
jgi:hypothetical protein